MRNQGTHFPSETETYSNRLDRIYRRLRGSWFTWWNKRKFCDVGPGFLAPERIYVVNGKNIDIGNNVFLGLGCQLYAYPDGRIKIGDNSSLDRYVEVRGGKEIRIGNQVRIIKNATLKAPDNAVLLIGDRAVISQGCIFDGGIKVGNDVTFGPNVFISDEDHGYASLEVPMNQQHGVVGETVIADDVWIGNGVSILKNVEIGTGSIVGAGSVVTKNIEPYTINVGIPCRKLKVRNPASEEKRNEASV